MSMYVVDNKNNKEIHRNLKMTKMNMTKERLKDMKSLFSQNVYQPVCDYTVDTVDLYGNDIAIMIAMHLMNSMRSRPDQTCSTRFNLVFEKADRPDCILTISDSASCYKTRDIKLSALVKTKSGRTNDVGSDVLCLDPIHGLDGAKDEFMSFAAVYALSIMNALKQDETPEEKEFKAQLCNKIRSEYTKLVAIRNIDDSYSYRKAAVDAMGIYINFSFTWDGTDEVVTDLVMSQNNIVETISTKNRPTIQEIRRIVDGIYNKFVENGGKLNG